MLINPAIRGLRDAYDLSTLFWSNTIDAQTGGTAILSNKRGISLKNVLSGDIKCNSITNVDYGLQFIDNCKVGTPGAKFLVQQNKFQGQGFGIGYNMGYGLVLGDGISTTTIIDDLGNGGASCGNKFYDPFANTYALYTISTDASLIKYQKNSAESALYADNSGSNVPGFEILPNNMTGSFTDDCSPYEKIDTENEGNSLSYEFNIFPNPTFSDLQIFYDKIPPLNCKINISTITGKEILNSILDGNSGSIKIDFSQFPSGVYIVSAFHNKTLLWYSKLIKIK